MPQATLLSYLTTQQPISAPSSMSGEALSKSSSAEVAGSHASSTEVTTVHAGFGIVDKVRDQLSTDERPITIPHFPNAQIVHISKSHLPSIQRLTSTTLPVRYGDNFFQSTITDETAAQLSRVALYSSEPIGWIRCCLEPCVPETASQPQLQQIYVQALALLAPYRGIGLASVLLDTIVNSSIAHAHNTVCIYAHVWEKNEAALDWYAKRGFKRVLLLERYYRRLKPAGAWIVRKELDKK
jgi:ribosomal protein S18 acetylase RimI-like enzyme